MRSSKDGSSGPATGSNGVEGFAFTEAFRAQPAWAILRGESGWLVPELFDLARAGLGLRYQNECVGLDLSLSRRFTSSATVLPTTDFTFRVSFDGFGTGVDAREYRRTCRG